ENLPPGGKAQPIKLHSEIISMGRDVVKDTHTHTHTHTHTCRHPPAPLPLPTHPNCSFPLSFFHFPCSLLFFLSFFPRYFHPSLSLSLYVCVRGDEIEWKL